jgi:hypothetical protein
MEMHGTQTPVTTKLLPTACTEPLLWEPKGTAGKPSRSPTPTYRRTTGDIAFTGSQLRDSGYVGPGWGLGTCLLTHILVILMDVIHREALSLRAAGHVKRMLLEGACLLMLRAGVFLLPRCDKASRVAFFFTSRQDSDPFDQITECALAGHRALHIHKEPSMCNLSNLRALHPSCQVWGDDQLAVFQYLLCG